MPLANGEPPCGHGRRRRRRAVALGRHRPPDARPARPAVPPRRLRRPAATRVVLPLPRHPPGVPRGECDLVPCHFSEVPASSAGSTGRCFSPCRHRRWTPTAASRSVRTPTTSPRCVAGGGVVRVDPTARRRSAGGAERLSDGVIDLVNATTEVDFVGQAASEHRRAVLVGIRRAGRLRPRRHVLRGRPRLPRAALHDGRRVDLPDPTAAHRGLGGHDAREHDRHVVTEFGVAELPAGRSASAPRRSSSSPTRRSATSSPPRRRRWATN